MKKNDPELNEIKEGFQILGADSGGLVNPNEFKEIMDIMNMSEKNPYIYNIILALCSDEETQQKGGIEANDFISLLEQNLEDTSSKGGIQNIFSVFSNSSTNKIPLPIFSQIVGNGEEFGEDGEKLKKLITKPEINAKELTFNEFQDIVKTDTPRQSMNENIIYKKKSSSNNQKYKYNEVKNIDGDDINNIGINFNNNAINNNNNFDGTNLRDSLDSPEKNIEKYNYRNNDSPNDKEDYNNRNQQYDYRNNKQEKIYINNNINNNNRNNNDEDYDNDNDIKNFDNFNIDKEQKNEEVAIPKKKYRHMRKSKNKDSSKDKFEDEEEKKIYYSNINKKKFTKGRIDNYDNDNEDYNDTNEYNDNIDNEEKGELKSERRYHRRYRDVKSSTPDKKDEKMTAKEANNGDINNKITSGHSRYRKNK